MPLSRAVIAVLQCPACGASVAPDGEVFSCQGPACGIRYPTAGGAPVFVDDQAMFKAEEFLADATARDESGPGSTSMHALVQSITPEIERRSRTLEMLGRVSMRARAAANGCSAIIVVIGMQGLTDAHTVLRQGDLDLVRVAVRPDVAGADLACGLNRLPFREGTADAVVIVDSLHRSLNPAEAAREIVRILRPAGVLYVEEPCVEPVLGGPDDFFRFTQLGLRSLFINCEELASGMTNGPGTALALAWRHFLWSIPSSRRWGIAWATFGSLTSFLLARLDAFLEQRARAMDAAATVYFLGQRASKTISVPELLASYRGAAARASNRAKRMRPANEVFTAWAAEGLDVAMQNNHAAAVEEMLAAAYEALGNTHGFTAIDAGCGNGWIVRRLRESEHCLTAIGVDGSAGMIAKARAFDPVGHYMIADLASWEPTEPVDLVVSMEVLYYLDDPVLLLRHIATTWLKPGGYAVFGIDHYEENEASLRWPTGIGVRMTTWPEARWRSAVEDGGFEVKRVWRAAVGAGEAGTLAMLVRTRSGRTLTDMQEAADASNPDTAQS